MSTGQTQRLKRETKQTLKWRPHCHKRGEGRRKSCLERWLRMSLDDAEKSYEVNVHNRIMDTAIEAIHRRFLTHSNLCADLACLDPRNFPQLCTSAFPQSALKELSKCLQGFDSRATKENMQAELKSLAVQWNRLKASPLAEYKARTVEDGSGGEEDNTEAVEITPISCCSCKECPLCCYQILQRFNMLTDAYPVLGLAY